MDKMTSPRTTRSERFRTPSQVEKRLGLWVDRIGSAYSMDGPREPRLLGLYGLVFIEDGAGVFGDGRNWRTSVGPGSCLFLRPHVPHVYYPARRPWRTR